MANLYLRSTDGVDGDNGSTWALARATTTATVANDQVGDVIYVSQAHNEVGTSTITINVAGTQGNPTKILCANDGAEPPTILSTQGQIKTSGSFAIEFLGSHYTYGLNFTAGDASGTANIVQLAKSTGSDAQVYESCQFVLGNTSASSVVQVGHITGSFPGKAVWKNCGVKFSNASQRIQVSAADFQWKGGSVQSGTTTPTNGLILAAGTGRGASVLVEGVDLSNFGSTLALVSSSSMQGKVIFRNCKLPAGWGGALFNSAPTTAGVRAEMYNCDSGDTNYRLHIEDSAGTIKSETAITMTGGATNGTTAMSWKMATTANSSELANPLASPEIYAWNDAVGATVSAKLNIVRDSATALTNADIWLEVQYYGQSGNPLGVYVSDGRVSVLSTAESQTVGSATWNTTGMTNPNKQELSVSFTPQEKGYMIAKVFVGKPSTTVFVDPKLTVA